MNKLILGIIVHLFSYAIFSQNRLSIDSLHRVLMGSSLTDEKAEIHFALNKEWAEFSFDSAMIHASKGLNLAKRSNSPGLISQGYNAMGRAYDYQYQLDSAMYYYTMSRDLSAAHKDTVGLSNAVINLGNISLMTGKLEDALKQYLEAYQLYKMLDDRRGMAMALNNQALIYRRTKQYTMARNTLFQSISIYEEEGEKKKTYSAITNLASAYLNLEDYDSAIYTAKRGIVVAKTLQNRPFELYPLVILGQSFEKLHQLDSSFWYYRLANEMVSEDTPAAMKTYIYFGLATFYLNQDEHQPAKPYLDLLQELGTIEKNLDMAVSYYEMTAKFHRLNGDLKTAYGERLKHEEMKEKYHDKQLIERTIELEQIFEKEKRELEIANLKTENEKQSQKTQALIAISILALISLIFVMVVFRQRQARNKLQQQLLHEEINGLRLRLGKVFSDVKLKALDTKVEQIQTAFHNELSEREAEILLLAVTNKTNAEIADEVHLSVNTVKYHLKNVYNKIGVSSRLEARQVMTES